MTKIYADFNKLDDVNCLKLTTQGSLRDIAALGVSENMEVVFYTDDLLVKGILQYNKEKGYWVGQVDWDSLYHT